jgi:hypothetical protein
MSKVKDFFVRNIRVKEKATKVTYLLLIAFVFMLASCDGAGSPRKVTTR